MNVSSRPRALARVEGPASRARTADFSTPLRSARDDTLNGGATFLFSQVIGEFCSRHGDLLAAGQILDCELIGLYFVFADDDDVARARLFRQLERLLQPESFVAEIGARTCTSQLARQLQGV